MPPAVMGQTYGANYVWTQWVNCDQTTTGASINETVWANWNQTASSGTMITSSQVWESWVGQTGAYAITSSPATSYQPRQLTEEEKVAQAERQEQWRRDENDRKTREIAVRAKAKELLKEILDEQQAEEFAKSGFFHVHTRMGERTYRLQPGHPPRLVKSLDKRMFSYCIHPREPFPAEDTVAALKLLIDADENEFLRIANATFVGTQPVAA